MSPNAQTVSFAAFWDAYIRVPAAHSGTLVKPTPHREQRRFITAMDTRDQTGLRPFQEAALHWAKKSAKSGTGGAAGLYHLIADPFEPDDRLIAIASYDAEQSHIVYRAIEQFI